MRTGLKLFLILFLLPTLVGGAVLLVAGRPIAFELLKWRTARRFPEVRWVTTEQLSRWRADLAEPQPVVLDARTQDEYAVSRLRGAVRIDPYRPSLRPIKDFRKDTLLLVYSSAGYRGARVASWLGKQGYTSVHNLVGGIFAWTNEGRPIFRGETPAAQVHPYDHNWQYLVDKPFRAEAPDIEKHSAAP